MHFRLLILAALSLALFVIASSFSVSAAQEGDWRILPVKPGINTYSTFTPDGGSAMIVKAWRDNGNAHGYYRYVILAANKERRKELNLIGIEKVGDIGLDDSVRDAPHTGEDAAQSVYFLKNKNGGTYLALASRPVGESWATPSVVTLRLYLLSSGEGPGDTMYVFRKVEEKVSAQPYNNTCRAFFALMDIPLPDGAEADRISRCQ